MIYTDDGLRLEGVIYHISITYLSLRRKRIRDASIYTSKKEGVSKVQNYPLYKSNSQLE